MPLKFSWGWATTAAFALWWAVMWFGSPGASTLILPMVRTGLGWALFGVGLGLGLRAIGDWSGAWRHLLGVGWVILSICWLFSALFLVFVTLDVSPRVDAGGSGWVQIQTGDFGPPEGGLDTFLYRCQGRGLWCRRCDGRARFFEPLPYELTSDGPVGSGPLNGPCELPAVPTPQR